MQERRRLASGADWRAQRRLQRRRQIARRRRRGAAGGALLIAIAAVAAIAASGGGTKPSGAGHRGHGAGGHGDSAKPRGRRRTGREGTAVLPAGVAPAPRGVSAPVLMYHVINPPPAGAPFPGLYVPASEFAEQMQALAGAGFHAVTLQQLWTHWRTGAPLPARPVVVTFDNGYQSQYTNALPVLRRLGWKAVENIQLTGLPPSQGGLSQTQVRGLVSAGWELDTQGISHADLIALDAAQLHYQVAVARQTIQRRYHVPVNWFCYPSGHYDATVLQAVRQAGYLGSTTVVPGWAGPDDDSYRLPRLRVLGGTSGAQLVELISATRHDPPPPSSYG
jgi:peptidoglycan/xylan/chitin deacetylase (PgdA/CDA1 family)